MEHELISATATPLAKTAKVSRSTLISRNVTVSGHRTSVRLEPDMWSGLSEICRREHASLHELCTAVSTRKAENTSLTAAIRVFVMAYFRAAATDEGHIKAGHGYGQSLGAPKSMPPQTQQAAPRAATSPYMMGANRLPNGEYR
ncbi:MAG: ribbon-helix-helix domain-containing protein [Alphaproteobacteria bacterium]